ncbi:MAG: archease [Thermoplasmata archaeon]|nr:archease [Thermoplasmata archaeon]
MLEGLGLGLFALMTDLRRVRPTEERAVSASGDDPPALVVAFLSQLLLLHEHDHFLVRRIEVRALGAPPTALVARVEGEPFDASRHAARTEVKAITLHALVFDAARGQARVIVDI